MGRKVFVAPLTDAASNKGPFATTAGSESAQVNYVTYHGCFVQAGSAGFITIADGDGNIIGGASATAAAPGRDLLPEHGLHVKAPLVLTNASSLVGTVDWS